jgi:hypothetical protein
MLARVGKSTAAPMLGSRAISPREAVTRLSCSHNLLFFNSISAAQT